MNRNAINFTFISQERTRATAIETIQGVLMNQKEYFPSLSEFSESIGE